MGGNVDSIPHFYLRNHVGERFYLTFKSLSGHVRCLSLKSLQSNHSSTKVQNPFPLYSLGYFKFSIACLWKTLCDNFYHEQAVERQNGCDWNRERKRPHTHTPARNRPKSPSINVSIFSNQSLTSSNILCFHCHVFLLFFVSL